MGTGAGPGDPRFGRRDDPVDRRSSGNSESPSGPAPVSRLAPVTYLHAADRQAEVLHAAGLETDALHAAELEAGEGAAGRTREDLYAAADRSETSAAGWTIPGIDYSEVRDRAERSGARRGNHPAGSRMLQQGVHDEGGSSSGAPSGSAGVDSPTSATGSGSSARRERRAENVSMAALTRRGMSRWEIERTLTARELEPDVVAAEIARLESVGLIDDAELADTIVRTQHDRKGLGRSALIAELRRRHIDQEHIDVALEQVDDDDELQTALGLAERRARQLTSLDRETAARRLTGYLMRKGYGSQVVRTAVDEALAGHRGSSPGGVRFR